MSPLIGKDFSRLLVMKKSKVKAERCYANGLFIDVHASNLLMEDRPQFLSCWTFNALLSTKETDYSAKRFHQKNPRTACRIQYARPFLQHVWCQCICQYELNQRRRGVVRTLVAIVLYLYVIKLLVNRTD